MAEAEAIARPANVNFAWLRNRNFDLAFIWGFACLAIAAGNFTNIVPTMFPVVMATDNWFLGYHHVVSTYTRIAFDKASIKEHFFLVAILPIIVLAGVLSVSVYSFGWVVPTIYLYWQWFHSTRQSYGVSRYYLAKAGQTKSPGIWIDEVATYAIPVVGILRWSSMNPDTMLYLPVRTLPVPPEAVLVAGGLAAVALAAQFTRWYKLHRDGQPLPGAYIMYMLSHHIVFSCAYLLLPHINNGWQVMSIWHNTQYISFAWLLNNMQYKNGVDPKHKLISTLSQTNKVPLYILTCLLVTWVFYYGAFQLSFYMRDHFSLVSAVLIIFMSINIHHYIVDGIIWRRKKTSAKTAPAVQTS